MKKFKTLQEYEKYKKKWNSIGDKYSELRIKIEKKFLKLLKKNKI